MWIRECEWAQQGAGSDDGGLWLDGFAGVASNDTSELRKILYVFHFLVTRLRHSVVMRWKLVG